MRICVFLSVLAALLLCAGPSAGQSAAPAPAEADPSPAPARAEESIPPSRLALAEQVVRASGRYMHQDQLRPGMVGYGLTVLSGAEIVRFEVEIVSVVGNYFPQRDMILVRCRGQNLQDTGIISGMSGSPVYMTDPADGQDKMIGAIAYGWTYSKGALGGVQPIAQMLATGGDHLASVAAEAGVELPASMRPDQPAEPEGRSSRPRVDPQWIAAVTNPDRQSVLDWLVQQRPMEDVPAGAAMLRPLSIPLSVGGLSEPSLELLREHLAGTPLTPVAGAGAAGGPEGATAETSLEPGAALAVPLVAGDMNIAAVGTVTDVIDGRVLGFGHPMFNGGSVELPMAAGYIHAVVNSIASSFKLASGGQIVGVLNADEAAAVGGDLGDAPGMIPVSVTVHWPDYDESCRYEYQLVREQLYTAFLGMVLISESVNGNRGLPPMHTLDYQLRIDFGQLGQFEIANTISREGILWPMSDYSRVVAAMANNVFGEAYPEGVELEMTLTEQDRSVLLIGAELDRNEYQPGDTVAVTMRLREFRGEPLTRRVSFTLPEDLPEGDYPLSVGDAFMAVSNYQSRNVHLFNPQDLPGLLASLQESVEGRMDRVYLDLDLGPAGIAAGMDVIDQTPPTVAAALAKSVAREDLSVVGQAVTADRPMDSILIGDARMTVHVREPGRGR